MRRFQTGARFSVGFSGLALLAFFLSAPVFLHAQSGSSSPPRTQSQPAQPATSAPSSSTQSQTQTGQPCSPDVAPILKRGKQADLPPCPDAPAAASSPADSSARSEAQRPLISWNLVEWEDAPPLVILHYKGQRYSSPSQDATYKDLFSVTEEKKDSGWTVTKYDSFY